MFSSIRFKKSSLYTKCPVYRQRTLARRLARYPLAYRLVFLIHKTLQRQQSRRLRVALGLTFLTHKKSKESLMRRQVQRLIHSNSFHDRLRCETVSKLSRIELLALLNHPVQLDQVPEVEKGEVLVDSRGEGSLQRMR